MVWTYVLTFKVSWAIVVHGEMWLQHSTTHQSKGLTNANKQVEAKIVGFLMRILTPIFWPILVVCGDLQVRIGNTTCIHMQKC